MTKARLNDEEQAILDAYESGDFVSVMTEERKDHVLEMANNTFKKDKRINIRISNRDLIAIQKRAQEEGIPYQTLVSSIIHKYVSGSWRNQDVSNSPPV